MITSSRSLEQYDTRVWDVNTGVDVACVMGAGCVAVSQSASAFAVGDSSLEVHLYDWSGADIGTVDVDVGWNLQGIQFTLCGKYLVVGVHSRRGEPSVLRQYDVASMSCVITIGKSFLRSRHVRVWLCRHTDIL